ncbi:MAG TPA: hypothetical protein VLT32_09780 [Candidatus Sulfomarinibacteraceae bacterium]|nr:hypothetical protein [Candidatus Sulfomarinibacteraceae bacterium]
MDILVLIVLVAAAVAVAASGPARRSIPRTLPGGAMAAATAAFFALPPPWGLLEQLVEGGPERADGGS